jgi:hypothetical protein
LISATKRIAKAYPKSNQRKGQLKMNGKPGDHPITDIVKWKLPRFSPIADALIAEIIQFGAQQELECTFNLFAPPPRPSFEAKLKEMRDRIFVDRKERGWEI